MQKYFLTFILVLITFTGLSQKSGEIYFSIGKYASSYRFFKYYTGYVNANIGYSRPFAEKLYVSSEYNFGFMHNKRTNNNAYDNSLHIGISYDLYKNNNFAIRGFGGAGYQHLYMQTAYDFLKFNEYLNGISTTASIKFIFVGETGISVFFKARSCYGFMFKSDFAPYPYYFRTWFNSISAGFIF